MPGLNASIPDSLNGTWTVHLLSFTLTYNDIHKELEKEGEVLVKCAVERRIPISRPSWIMDSYQG
ncbi:hypothetical protein M378DRAFT_167598 [Amanita muscaria Koide BX008]|uniref:Uncharacterized protein n=1 Tax=Amanita muscaria (strain Koide BX008) TaxID=946122 RepID=A0A0C2WVU4_AMAMK|nr:hypothetical protein M378DRAFT_167598 [Amanita muscaria Koide BX008]